MNKFVDDCIKTNGEIIILLGVRKAESNARYRSISEKEIAGYLLNPHNNIDNAYVYNPLTEIKNDLVWEYLLKDDGISPWGTSMKLLFITAVKMKRILLRFLNCRGAWLMGKQLGRLLRMSRP